MAVTEVVFDPRIDLPDGSLGIQAVTVRAAPTRIREAGPSTVYPQTVNFTNITGATPLYLQSTDGTWAWTIGVYLRSKLLDVRTVFVTGDRVAYPDLVDIDPVGLEDGHSAPPAWWAAIATYTSTLAMLVDEIAELKVLITSGGGGSGGSSTVIVESSTGGILTLTGAGVTEQSGILTLTGSNVTEQNGLITIS